MRGCQTLGWVMQEEPDKDIKHAADTGVGCEDAWFLSNNGKRELFKTQKMRRGGAAIAQAPKTAAFEGSL